MPIVSDRHCKENIAHDNRNATKWRAPNDIKQCHHLFILSRFIAVGYNILLKIIRQLRFGLDSKMF